MRSMQFPRIAAALVLALVVATPTAASAKFKLEEATIADVHHGYAYELGARNRRVPPTTPRLAGEM